MSARILITGSRDWTDFAAIVEALQDWKTPGAVLVEGGAQGADRLAATIWRAWGLTVEEHPADWDRHGKRAGYLRNQEMIDAGADVCLAFILDNSPGAIHCANAAETAGIPTERHRATSHVPAARTVPLKSTRGKNPAHLVERGHLMTARRGAENAGDAAAGRWARDPDEPPIVLSGGPADGHWYWRDDFEGQQLAARRIAAMHHRTPLDPASWPLLSAPTRTVVTHDRDPQKQATRWVWTGPAEVHILHDLACLAARAATAPPAAPACRPGA